MAIGADEIAPFAISIGDPAGIGPEIICKAWEARETERLHPFFVVGCAAVIRSYWPGPLETIDDPDQATDIFPRALPVFHLEECTQFEPGVPTAEGAHCAFHALEMATGFARSGRASAIVTGPVSKAQLYAVGFNYPGQTEFVAERCGVSSDNAIMMLAGPDLRVVPVTTHIPLREVSEKLTSELLLSRIRATARGLTRNFGIRQPRLAVAGFNPHAGEDGKMGTEEIDVMTPAVEQARAEGIDVTGPLPADTMFHPRARQKYDVALCAYHDQALIPLKTLYFDQAVNITLGLPIVRTSPDHGTAFDIAGQNIARADSMIAAIRMAHDAVRNRLFHKA
jgi:4-hydroxythreonine-4-phosphate dehydrogenase